MESDCTKGAIVSKMKVVFLGNHTVGVRALEAISESEEIVGVVAHPPDEEDGVRYLSVYDFAVRRGWKVIRSKGKDAALKRFIMAAKPDLLWITDYRYLLPFSLLSMAPLGVVNLHPSLLPKYRGRAPINWAILHGETTLGLTAHFVDEGMDTGDIIEQISFELKPEQDVAHALEILYPLYSKLTDRVLKYFRSGKVPRKPQDHTQATVFPRRRPKDGLIDWKQSNRSICNLVRAVASPYPGGFTVIDSCKIRVWKASLSPLPTSISPVPGMILHRAADGVHVQCGDGVLLLTRVDVMTDNEQPASMLERGVILGNNSMVKRF